MKVKELIKKLSKLDSESVVIIGTDEGYSLVDEIEDNYHYDGEDIYDDEEINEYISCDMVDAVILWDSE